MDLLARLVPTVRGILTAEQLRKLPPFISGYLDTRYLAAIRSGTPSFTGTGAMPGGMAAVMAGGGRVEVGGGGTSVTVIRQP